MIHQHSRERCRKSHIAVWTVVILGLIAVITSCNDEDSQVSDHHDDGEDDLLSNIDSSASVAIENTTRAKTDIRMPDIVGISFGASSVYIGTGILQSRLTEWYPRLGFSRLDEALNDYYYNSEGRMSTAVELLTFEDEYIAQIVGQFEVKHVADDLVLAGYVIEQEPAPGVTLTQDTEVVITVSAGRPTITFDQLPDNAKQLLGGYWRGSAEAFLVVNTPYGIAYKSDGLLFGPCVAVRAAYRTLSDGSYGNKCYDSKGWVSSGAGQILSSIRNLVGLPYTEAIVAIMSEQIDPYQISADRIVAEWIASNDVPLGIVVSQNPPAGSPLLVEDPVELEVSAGGPAVGFDELPDAVVAWLATVPLASAPFVLGYEPILVVRTSEGTAYKTDQHLFGPCAAVRAAYDTFEDEHYDTITPNPCTRLEDIDISG